MDLQQLKTQPIWKFFLEMTQIPRPSGDEEKFRQHLIGWAKKHNFKSNLDGHGNLIISVPASQGLEKSPIIVIQGHLDMVAEKTPDSKVDPLKDPLDVYIEGDWVTARGTTLGADNGIGMAAGMAAATDDNIRRGPLELLFTFSEETAMVGAGLLTESFVKGRMMINLDTEVWGTFYVGCSGGEDSIINLPVKSEQADTSFSCQQLTVAGLQGGHSGLNIHENRSNSIKLLARTLKKISKECNCQLAHVQGGNLKNAIPRDAKAKILFSATDLQKAQKIVAEQNDYFSKQYAETDKELTISLKAENEEPNTVFSKACTKTLLDLILAIPNGPLSMSPEILGLVETSNNIGVLKTEGEKVMMRTQNRFTGTESMNFLRDQIVAVAELAGAEIELTDWYPSWKPNMKSKLLSMLKASYEELFNKSCDVTAIHAGLECGFILEKLPDCDMIAFGPSITGAHSPDERLQISTVQPFYNLLKNMLEKLA